MSLLLVIIVVLIVVGLLVWAVDFIPLPAPFNNIVKVLLVLFGVFYIVQRTGIF